MKDILNIKKCSYTVNFYIMKIENIIAIVVLAFSFKCYIMNENNNLKICLLITVIIIFLNVLVNKYYKEIIVLGNNIIDKHSDLLGIIKKEYKGYIFNNEHKKLSNIYSFILYIEVLLNINKSSTIEKYKNNIKSIDYIDKIKEHCILINDVKKLVLQFILNNIKYLNTNYSSIIKRLFFQSKLKFKLNNLSKYIINLNENLKKKEENNKIISKENVNTNNNIYYNIQNRLYKTNIIIDNYLNSTNDIKKEKLDYFLLKELQSIYDYFNSCIEKNALFENNIDLNILKLQNKLDLDSNLKTIDNLKFSHNNVDTLKKIDNYNSINIPKNLNQNMKNSAADVAINLSDLLQNNDEINNKNYLIMQINDKIDKCNNEKTNSNLFEINNTNNNLKNNVVNQFIENDLVYEI